MSRYKPYPVYKDSGVEWIGKVPEGWEVKPVYSVATVRSGYPFASEQFKNNGSKSDRLIRIRDLAGDDEAIYTKEVCPSSAVISNGDVLIGMDGDFNVHRWMRGPGKLNQRMCIASGRTEEVTQFLSRCLPTPLLIINDLAYATTVKHLSSYEVLHTRIPAPPTNELLNINSVLDRETARIDALISRKTRFIELLQEKRQALITHAVTKGIDPNVKMKDSGVEWIGEVPEHWTLFRLANVGSLVKANGGNKQDDTDGGVPCIRYGDLYTTYDTLIRHIRKFISPTAETDYTAIKYGDILFAASGETFEEIGKSAANLTETRACCGGDVIILRPKRRIDPIYLAYAAGSLSAQAQKSLMGKGFTVIHVYGDQLRNLVIAAPSEQEQKLIGAKIESETARIDTLIAKTQRSIDLIKERRSAFITAAVTGQIDLRDAA